MNYKLLEGNAQLSCIDTPVVASGYSDFFDVIVTKIGNEWEGTKLDRIPANDIRSQQRARIWLFKMNLETGRLLKCLVRQSQ